MGYLGFLALTPLILGFDVLVQWVFHEVIGVEPIPHPLLELGKSQLEPFEWLLFWFQVGVTAPIMEEFYFRGIFQGWLLSRPFSPARRHNQGTLGDRLHIVILGTRAFVLARSHPTVRFRPGPGLSRLPHAESRAQHRRTRFIQ